MDRISVVDAQHNLDTLVDRVVSLGTSIDLERDERVVARLCPVRSESKVKIGDLAAFLANLPPLEDDAAVFGNDVRNIRRELPPETSAWD